MGNSTSTKTLDEYVWENHEKCMNGSYREYLVNAAKLDMKSNKSIIECHLEILSDP